MRALLQTDKHQHMSHLTHGLSLNLHELDATLIIRYGSPTFLQHHVTQHDKMMLLDQNINGAFK